jgi:hypothetical protein
MNQALSSAWETHGKEDVFTKSIRNDLVRVVLKLSGAIAQSSLCEDHQTAAVTTYMKTVKWMNQIHLFRCCCCC